MVEAIVGVALRAILASVLLGGVLAAIVGLATRVLALTAATRHALWTTALVATGIMPLAGIGVSVARAVVVEAPASAAVTRSAPSMPANSHATSLGRPSPHDAAATREALPDARAPQVPRDAHPATWIGRIPFARWTPTLSRTLALGAVAVWAAGALAGLIGLIASIVRVRGLKRRSSPLDGTLADELPWLTEARAGREIYVRLSYETETPVAIGFRRPVILIPTELATADGLSAIEPLVMHEHAHLRRLDDWTNLVQRVIERLFWFNPILWLVGRRIALEREIASDDAVVERTGAAHDYATSLWRLAREMRMPEHAVVAPGALLTRKQITVRIEQLLDENRSRLHRSPAAALVVAAAGALAVAAVATSAPAVELPATAMSPTAVHEAAPQRSSTAWEPAPSPRPAVPAVHRAPESHAAAPAHPVAAATTRIVSSIERRIVYVHDPAPKAPAHAAVQAPSTPQLPPLPPEATQGLRSAAAVGPIVGAAVRDALASIPRQVAQSTSSSSSRSSSSSSHRELDGTRLTREIVAACTGCSFRNADAHGLDLHGLKITGDTFSGADLRGANLAGARLSGVSLRGANLGGADLRAAELVGVEIRGANFDGAQLDGVRLTGVSMRGTTLRGAALRSVFSSCTGCDFAGMDLHGQDLHGITLIGADLSRADLHDANLSGAQLNGVDLSRANLAGADLTNTRLVGCDVSGVDMRGARTTGMTMTGSDTE